jgi:PKHD-type hydroxylase
MSIYNLSPGPAFNQENWAYWENGWSQNEIYQIRNVGEKFINNESKATVDSGVVDKEIRRSKTSWLKADSESIWIYDKLGFIVRRLNSQFFQFDISGFVEDLQYTVYDGNEEGFYDWHVDAGPNTDSPRKLSMVVQLSEPDEYEGGDLQLWWGGEPITVKKELGFTVVFPSYVLHKVSPVTKGVRRTLVVWLSGPRFR